jgi:hypothetical protein
MISAIYELIGRLAVRFVWLRYGRQIRIAAALGLGAVLVGGYLAARREPPEG